MPPALPRVDRTASFDRIGDLLAEHGAVLVERLFDAAVIDAVNAEIDDAVASYDPSSALHNQVLTDFHGPATRHVTALAAKSRTFATEIMAHPMYRALCARFLIPAIPDFVSSNTTWQLNLAHMIVRGPGSPDQLLHRDEDVWMDMPYPRSGELQIASMIAFVDFTRENGATRVIPGSHAWPERQTPITQRLQAADDLESQCEFAEMPAGSAVVYLGSTLHGGSTNTSADTWRRGGHLSFTHGWLRTEENNYLAVPPSIARALPRECQEILGYPIYGFLGTLDMLDPVELMADGRL